MTRTVRLALAALALIGAGSCTEPPTGTGELVPSSLTAVNSLEYTASAGLRTFPAPIVVARDAAGNPVPGVQVVFSAGPSGGSVEGAEQTTGADGRAHPVAWWLGTAKGSYTLTATSGAHSVTFTALTVTGPPAQLIPWAFVDQTTFPGALVSRPPAVRLMDAEGLPVLNAVLDWRDASGAVLCQSVTVSGVAQYGCGWRPGTSPGTYTIAAVHGSLRANVSATVVLPPASLAFAAPVAPAAFPAGSDLPGGVEVQVRTSDGSPAVGYAVSFSSNGQLGPTTTVTDAAGVARATLHLSPYAGQSWLSVALDTISIALRASIPIAGTGTLYATSIAAGGSHTCGTALTPGATFGTVVHSLFCWGSNSAGQIGDGTVVAQRASPRLVASSFDGKSFSPMSVFTGADHSCAFTSDSVRCWGSNEFGQLGVGGSSSAVPVAVPTAAFGMSLGAAHSCARTSESVDCWGFNGTGALGDGTTTSRAAPAPVELSGISGRVGQIAAGDGFTCALAQSIYVSPGTAYCWGRNTNGQLGDGTTANRTRPVPVSGIPFRSLNYPDQLFAGYAHACAIVTEGVTSGPVGAGGGRLYGMAYCWGDNTHGQLGDGTRTSRSTPAPVAGGKTFYSLTLGGAHTCGTATDGQFCWGSNADGQLGTGAFDAGSSTPVLLASPSLPPFGVLVAGQHHTCGIRAGGAAFCWGRNSSGQLGDGTTTNRAVPTPVADFHP
jgi:alpha-tubulin suppressor-like RCC1 family protein